MHRCIELFHCDLDKAEFADIDLPGIMPVKFPVSHLPSRTDEDFIMPSKDIMSFTRNL